MNKSTTVAEPASNELTEAMLDLEATSWHNLIASLPADLEGCAKAQHALVRRRAIQSALDLLRMIFAYAVCDWSLRMVGAWLVARQLADLSDVAILKRLQHSRQWLGSLIADQLRQRRIRLAQRPGVRLRLVDASEISDAHHHNWYVHACVDLGQMCLAGVEVTDAHGSESLARFPGQAGDIQLCDAGYAKAKGLGASLAVGALTVTRCNWQNLAYLDEHGQRLNLLDWLKQLPHEHSFDQPAERQIWLQTPQGRFALRLIVSPLPQQALERAHRRVRERAGKKGRTASADNLFAAGFILLLSNLPVAEWSGAEVLELYRFRWQVELLFKRYKSIFKLDALRAHDPELVQTYLLAKLLAALLLDDLTQDAAALVPDWFTSLERPVSLWRISQLFWEQLRRTIQGVISWQRLLDVLPRLQRFLCDSPRRRRQQLAVARAFASRLCSVDVPDTARAEP